MKSPKALDLFWKAYFQTKVTKSGRCYNLVPGRILWGNFRGNRSSWGAFFMFLHVMFALCTSQNSDMEALWLSKSQQSRKNQKQRKVFVQKKKKEKAQRRKKECHSVKNRKKSLVKATGTGGAPRWHPDFEQRGRRQTKICHTKS